MKTACDEQFISPFPAVFLTLYNTFLTFNDPLEAFSPFPAMFSTLSKREIVILAMFKMSSANTFNLITSKILSFGQELNIFYHKRGTDKTPLGQKPHGQNPLGQNSPYP